MINGNSITLSSTYVSAPVAVRYGYGTFFRVNLFNKAGLPAVPFRTDTFAPDTYYRLFADSEISSFPGSVAAGSWKTPVFLVMRKE